MMTDDGRLSAEGAVLSAMTCQLARGAAAYALARLDASDFGSQVNRTLFSAMAALAGRGEPIDTVTLCEELRISGHLDKVGGPSAVLNLIADGQIVGNYRTHVHSVKEYSIKAQAATVGELLQHGGSIDSAIRTLTGLAAQLHADETTPEEQARQFTETMNLRMDGKLERPVVSTGFEVLDGILGGGFGRGTLNILAARPGMGKTGLAINIALHAAFGGRRVLFFSLEMTHEEIRERALSAMTYVNFTQIHVKPQSLADTDKETIRTSLKGMEQLPNLILDDKGHSPEEISSRIIYEKETGGLDLVIIDHLGLIRIPDKRGSTLAHEIGVCTSMMKQVAKRAGVSVLLLCQVSRRGIQDKADKRPQLTDLRDSGRIEEDADTITFLHREAYYTRSGDTTTEVIIAKNRNGITQTVLFDFLSRYMTFDEKKNQGAAGFGGELLTAQAGAELDESLFAIPPKKDSRSKRKAQGNKC